MLVDALFGLPLTGLRVLVADDNSPDGTVAAGESKMSLKVQLESAIMPLSLRRTSRG